MVTTAWSRWNPKLLWTFSDVSRFESKARILCRSSAEIDCRIMKTKKGQNKIKTRDQFSSYRNSKNRQVVWKINKLEFHRNNYLQNNFQRRKTIKSSVGWIFIFIHISQKSLWKLILEDFFLLIRTLSCEATFQTVQMRSCRIFEYVVGLIFCMTTGFFSGQHGMQQQQQQITIGRNTATRKYRNG